MSQSSEELFDIITKAFISNPKISQSKMFGSPGLKISGKVFAFLTKGRLVLKLPKKQVDVLVATKEGKHFGHMFAPRNFRPMKEWVALELASKDGWLRLAEEAKKFVEEK